MSEPRPTGEIGPVEAAEAAVEGLPGALSMAPTGPIPALGGELLLPPGEPGTEDLNRDTVRAGLLQAGPLAAAGLVANGANLVVTIFLARLLTTRGFGHLNQLIGLFLIVSMPGSAVTVAVVRRVTAWRGSGSAHLVRRWAARVHAQGTLAVVVFGLVVLLGRNWFAHTIGQKDAAGAVCVLVAGAVWVLLSLDRGLLQAHRSYRVLAGNLLVEGGARTVTMLTLVGLGFGVTGAALAILLTEVITCGHARLRADRIWSDEVLAEEARGEGDPARRGAPGAGRPGLTRAVVWGRALSVFRPAPDLSGPREERRDLLADLATAFVALAMVALLQNIDVIVIGRDNPSISGSYAAVSVACKALVFGAVILGGYLLPEAAIRWRQGGHALRQLAVTLLVLAVPAVALLTLAVVSPGFLLQEVFSGKYLGAEVAFLPLVLAMVCLSVTVMLTMYLLAVGRRWITGVLILGALAATLAVVHAHGSALGTARADLAVQLVLMLVTAAGFAAVHHRRLGRGSGG